MYEVAKGVDLDFGGTAAGSAQNMSDAPLPFQPGGSAIAVLSVVQWAEAEAVGELNLQGSDNAFSGWEDLATVAGAANNCPMVMEEIVIPQYLRWSVSTVTAGDGRGSIYLLQV
jgi:hypothetical protein